MSACRLRPKFCIAQKQEDLPHAVICPLPEQFNGRLCSIHLPGWHVQIINKYDTLFPKRRSKYTLPPLVQLGHNDILKLIPKRRPMKSRVVLDLYTCTLYMCMYRLVCIHTYTCIHVGAYGTGLCVHTQIHVEVKHNYVCVWYSHVHWNIKLVMVFE